MNSQTEPTLQGLIFSLINRGYVITTKGTGVVLTRKGQSKAYAGFKEIYANKFLH
jgi:hypothetical protein